MTRGYITGHGRDAPDDETPTGASPRPRNPAGSANTAWTSRKYLAELDVRRRR